MDVGDIGDRRCGRIPGGDLSPGVVRLGGGREAWGGARCSEPFRRPRGAPFGTALLGLSHRARYWLDPLPLFPGEGRARGIIARDSEQWAHHGRDPFNYILSAAP